MADQLWLRHAYEKKKNGMEMDRTYDADQFIFCIAFYLFVYFM